MSIITDSDAPKRAVFLGTSLADLSTFPPEARRKAGKDIGDLQAGAMPPDWKPMPVIGAGAGAGAGEIRVQDQNPRQACVPCLLRREVP
jgi:phage-related protein